MQVLSVYLPIDKRLNAHAKGHWRSKSEPTKEARRLAAMMTRDCMTRQKATQFSGQVTVDYDFIVPDNRRRDEANMIQSCKPLIDGVVDAGLLSGDHWQVLTTGKTSVTIGGELAVALTFREVDE